jgi:dTDP-4-amino-4,6-dideoxygalactose transaminase
MNRNLLYDKLKEYRIHARKYYYPTVLDTPFHVDQEARYEDLSNTQTVAKRVLCLPVNPYFDDGDCDYIVTSLREILEGC